MRSRRKFLKWFCIEIKVRSHQQVAPNDAVRRIRPLCVGNDLPDCTDYRYKSKVTKDKLHMDEYKALAWPPNFLFYWFHALPTFGASLKLFKIAVWCLKLSYRTPQSHKIKRVFRFLSLRFCRHSNTLQEKKKPFWNLVYLLFCL